MSASKFGFFLLLSLIFFGSSQLQAKPFYAEENTVSVVGYGMVEVEPNEMRFHFGVDAKDPEVNVAYKRVESTLAKALKLLARMGVPSQQIQAMTAQINPIIDYKSRDQRHIGYEVRRDVNVKVDNLELYAKALAELAELGVTRFGQVQMRVSNRQALEIDALGKAYANAE